MIDFNLNFCARAQAREAKEWIYESIIRRYFCSSPAQKRRKSFPVQDRENSAVSSAIEGIVQ